MSRAMIERIDLHFQWPKGSTHREKRTYLPEDLQRKKYCCSFDDYLSEKKNKMMQLSLRPGGVTVEELSKELCQNKPLEGGKNDTLK